MRIPLSEKTISTASIGIIGAAIVLIIAGILYYTQQEKQRVAINEQKSTTDQLVMQVKMLSEANKQLNEQNRDYTYCNAMLFAQYTQDQRPIVIDDLQKCKLSAPERITAPQNTSQSAPQTTQKQVQSPAQSSQQANTPTPNPKPSDPTKKDENTLKLIGPCVQIYTLLKTC